jgi:hypothetical protein
MHDKLRRPTVLLIALLAALPGAGGAEPPRTSDAAAAVHDGQSDFDFVLGRWKVKNRVLSRRGGSDHWAEFDATSFNRPIWDGKANVEEWDGVGPSGRIQGFALRLYDPAARQWSIYWADRRYATLGAPAVGSFKDGRGEFFSDGTLDGKKTRERVVWIRLSPTTCHWEQGVSLDGGKTWETNWTMDFIRIGP